MADIFRVTSADNSDAPKVEDIEAGPLLDARLDVWGGSRGGFRVPPRSQRMPTPMEQGGSATTTAAGTTMELHEQGSCEPFDGELGLTTEFMVAGQNPFSTVTWHAGGLLPSITGATGRHSVARRFGQESLDSNDMVTVQETRGGGAAGSGSCTASDLAQALRGLLRLRARALQG